MKKFISIAMSLMLVTLGVASCGEKEVSNNPPASNANVAVDGLSGDLKIWSFTNEGNTFATAFKGKNPNVKIDYTMVPNTTGEYLQKLQQSLATNSDVPDVIFLEAAFLKQFVDSPFLKDLSDLKPKAEEMGTYDFTIEAGTDLNGLVKGYSFQATPGAYFYRRSLAKEYLGTDDPIEVQKAFENFDKFEETAQLIKEKSNGDTYIVSSQGDFSQLYFSNREQPWVVDNKLVIDPKIDELWEMAKKTRENKFEAEAVQWKEGWYAGMNDTLKDAGGTPKKVFGYLLPTWGLTYVLIPNSKTETTDTSGDWGIIPGPNPYQWGGTWLSVAENAKNPELAKAFVEFATLNEETLTDWATGVYTNEYLKAIDPSVGNLFQGAGDFVSSAKVVAEISEKFDDSETSKFLAGQNAYKAFGDVAPTISLKLFQGSDDVINKAMQDAMNSYVLGKMTKEEAMKSFKESVKIIMPDLEIE